MRTTERDGLEQAPPAGSPIRSLIGIHTLPQAT
jgi:hypothetical protein